MGINWGETDERSFSFTLHGLRMAREAADLLGEDETEEKGSLVYQVMRKELKQIPFGDHLKRYIYLNSGMRGPFRETSLEAYRQTLTDAFYDAGVPASLDGADVNLQTLAHRWLEQGRVSREVVMLLGFGLSMTEEEVNGFLTKALHEHRLDPEKPMEGICGYCYRHHYGWRRMQELLRQYQEGPRALKAELKGRMPEPKTRAEQGRQQDQELLRTLFRAKEPTAFTRKTRETFATLLQKTREKAREEGRGRAQREISGADVERIFCPIISRDRYGNLKMTIQNEVKQELSSHRFTRQHLHRVTSGNKEPDRYDLLTLGFYLQTGTGMIAESEERLEHYRAEMNRMLDACGFGPVYTGDPYECLLMMALSTPNPMETYVDVMRMARDQSGDEEE